MDDDLDDEGAKHTVTAASLRNIHSDLEKYETPLRGNSTRAPLSPASTTGSLTTYCTEAGYTDSAKFILIEFSDFCEVAILST